MLSARSARASLTLRSIRASMASLLSQGAGALTTLDPTLSLVNLDGRPKPGKASLLVLLGGFVWVVDGLGCASTSEEVLPEGFVLSE